LKTHRIVRALALFFPAVWLARGQVHFERRPDRLSVLIDGAPFTEIFQGPQTRKPYLHPLRSASGRIVTRRFPMETVPGEPNDHPHHQGLSFTHADVNGFNFWASDATQLDAKSGSIRLKRIVSTEDGKTEGRAVIEYEWLDPSGRAILAETRTLAFRGGSDRSLDLDIRLTALEKAVFGDTKEGTLSIRLAAPLEEERGGLMAGAGGCRTEKECWGSRGDWMDYSGVIDGEALGVAIFDHPGNPSHPTFWHSRAYGLFSANPFGANDFHRGRKEPVQERDGSMTLEKGASARFRYRILIHSGRTDAVALEEAYRAYSSRTP